MKKNEVDAIREELLRQTIKTLRTYGRNVRKNYGSLANSNWNEIKSMMSTIDWLEDQ